MSDVNITQGSFETVLPRLGDYLLQQNMISPEDLQKGLDYQQSQQADGQAILLGQALVKLGFIEQPVLDQAITRQILDIHAALKSSNRQFEEKVSERTQDLQRRLLQIRTAAEITQFAISARNLEELYSRVVNLIVERFGYYSASIYMVDDSGKNVYLVESAGPFELSMKQKGQVIEVGERSMVGWVAANNQPRISADVHQEFFYHLDDLLTDTLSEACVPISISTHLGKEETGVADTTEFSDNPDGVEILGVLDIQHDKIDAFDQDVLAVLQTIANHIASVIQNIQLFEIAQQRLDETTTLFNTSHRLSQAKNEKEVYASVSRTLEEASYPAGLLVSQGNEMWSYYLRTNAQRSILISTNESNNSESTNAYRTSLPSSVLSQDTVESLFPSGAGVAVLDFTTPNTYPSSLALLADSMETKSLVLIPVKVFDHIRALLVLGYAPSKATYVEKFLQVHNKSQILSARSYPVLDSFIRLTQLVSSTLEGISAYESLNRQVGALQSIGVINQLVSERIDLIELYRRTHAEVMRLIGAIDFIIALYEPVTGNIQIPYMVEIDPDGGKSHEFSVPPFPLGQGLTSIVLSAKKPLMINVDAENKARQLGGIILGKPAKSWLGVPLMFAGEPMGVLIIQDREHENRFSDQDQVLMSTLSAQIAVSIRNALLLESTNKQAEMERQLFEITSKIHNSINMETIIHTAATEIQKALKVRRARIEIDVDATLQSTVRKP